MNSKEVKEVKTDTQHMGLTDNQDRGTVHDDWESDKQVLVAKAEMSPLDGV